MRKLMAALAAAGAVCGVWARPGRAGPGVCFEGSTVRVSRGRAQPVRREQRVRDGQLLDRARGRRAFRGGRHGPSAAFAKPGSGWVRYWLSWEDRPAERRPEPRELGLGAGRFRHRRRSRAGSERLRDDPGCAGVGARGDAHLLVAALLRRSCLAGSTAYDKTRPGCGPAGAAHAVAPFDPGVGGGGQSANWKQFVVRGGQAVQRPRQALGLLERAEREHFWPEHADPATYCGTRCCRLVEKVIKPGREAALAANPAS